MGVLKTTVKDPAPRGRGSPSAVSSVAVKGGSIPAWAGEPQERAPDLTPNPVDPRVGGEPRLPPSGPPSARVPRGRGTRDHFAHGNHGHGYIPAWAGEPAFRIDFRLSKGIHPRVGGGALLPPQIAPRNWGPSPRGRGSPGSVPAKSRAVGSIPAWAGEPYPCAAGAEARRVHPRVGGGAPSWCADWGSGGGPSPRGRGSPERHARQLAFDGSIPAWAGEPRCPALGRRTARVHPRVGGGASRA